MQMTMLKHLLKQRKQDDVTKTVISGFAASVFSSQKVQEKRSQCFVMKIGGTFLYQN